MNAYKVLTLTIGIHFCVMYALTFVAVDTWQDVTLFNTRSLYMALVMVAPMLALMLFSMRHMYKNKNLNTVLYIGSTLLFFAAFCD